MLKKEAAYRIIDQLEVLCLKIAHPDRYADISIHYVFIVKYNYPLSKKGLQKTHYAHLLDSNSITTKKNLECLETMFNPEKSELPYEFRPYLDYIARFKYNLNIPDVIEQE